MKKLVYVSEMGTSGYARAARDVILALQSRGVQVAWRPATWEDGRIVEYRGGATGDRQLDPLREHPDDSETVVLHLMPNKIGPWLERFYDRRVIAHTVWETDRLPVDWVEPLNRTALVVVPCRWNQTIFRESGVTVPVEVVPHFLPADLPSEEGVTPSSKTVFYNIGEWTRRKGMELLVEAYSRAFSERDEVELVIKTCAQNLASLNHTWGIRHLVNATQSTQRTLSRLKKRHSVRAPIRLMTGNLPRERITRLHQSGDCFVSLCRAEGWGLGAFEAASIGNPVVMTGYGGQADFLDPELCSLVGYSLVPCRVGFYEQNFTPEQNWAEPDLDHAVKLMRWVHTNRSLATERATRLRKKIRAEYSPDRLIDRWSGLLDL